MPELFRRREIPVDVALVQTSPPDRKGYFSLGVSLDIVKAAIAGASLVVAQVNSNMPRVHGDTFVHLSDLDYIIEHDEPLLEYHPRRLEDNVAAKIGYYAAQIIEDGDTIQVGYGSAPDAVLAHLSGKKHLGVHTDLLSDGLIELLKSGVIDNSKKTINRGKTVATYCMGSCDTYRYLHDHPGIEFKEIDYTNNPLVIARHHNMVAINGALEIDLTGQVTAESIGKTFYSGSAGIPICARRRLARGKPSSCCRLRRTRAPLRALSLFERGRRRDLNRGDIQYVVTEYGLAYLHGKNIRERPCL